jgi:ABC-type multidrug transport system fused ATPase/permease subunit
LSVTQQQARTFSQAKAVDVATERAIYKRVRSFLPKTTLLVIAHRSAAAELADRVIRLEGGHIVAEEDASVGNDY